MSGGGILYLTGCTNDKIEPALIEQGIGLLVQPGSGYANRIPRFGFHGVDNGCFNPATYIGDDKYLDFVDRLPRDRCLFVAVPDVARRPDGSLGGDPVATWRRFQEMGPLVQDMGFPAALVAQNGIEALPDLREQLEACDALFLGGSTDWKLGLAAEQVTALARNLGKWVHMGRCNSASSGTSGRGPSAATQSTARISASAPTRTCRSWSAGSSHSRCSTCSRCSTRSRRPAIRRTEQPIQVGDLMAQAETSVEEVRCQSCRRFFDPSDEEGWFLQLSSNKVDSDPDGDWICSDPCLFKIAQQAWMDSIDSRLREFERAESPRRDAQC